MKKLWSLGVLAAFRVVMAGESFGGLGLAIYPSEHGAEVAHVVQGASAHLAGIEVGDFLVTANDVSLAGKSLDFDMEILRGKSGRIRGVESLAKFGYAPHFGLPQGDRCQESGGR